jgi:hypothetical protein
MVGLFAIGSAQIQPKPIKIVHKLTPGFADLNQPDGVMFAGILTYSAAYTYIFLYPNFVAVLLDRVCGTSGDTLVAPRAIRKRLGSKADIYEIVTMNLRGIVFQILHGDAAARAA